MSRNIDAEHFEERIRNAVGMVEYDLSEDFKDGILATLEMLKTEPTADVRENIEGEWKSSRPDAPMFGFYYCSLCGRKRTSPQDKFCPNCGARMVEE